MTGSRGGWVITPARSVDPRVLDADEAGGAVAETLAALSAAELLHKAPSPEAARDAADHVRYPTGGAPQSQTAAQSAAGACKADDVALEGLSLADAEPLGVSAAEMDAEERVAALHPPPPADSPEARPADRVPPVSASLYLLPLFSSYPRALTRDRWSR